MMLVEITAALQAYAIELETRESLTRTERNAIERMYTIADNIFAASEEKDRDPEEEYEKELENYYGGDKPTTAREQFERAYKEKRRIG